MTKKGKRTRVDRGKFQNYHIVAENFYKGAEVAREYEYWNAAGVLIIHAAIAYADAVSIKLGGVKCQGDNHQESVDLLDELVANDEKKNNALNQLRRMIEHKTSVSYSGEIYDESDVNQLWKYANRFRDWAVKILAI